MLTPSLVAHGNQVLQGIIPGRVRLPPGGGIIEKLREAEAMSMSAPSNPCTPSLRRDARKRHHAPVRAGRATHMDLFKFVGEDGCAMVSSILISALHGVSAALPTTKRCHVGVEAVCSRESMHTPAELVVYERRPQLV